MANKKTLKKTRTNKKKKNKTMRGGNAVIAGIGIVGIALIAGAVFAMKKKGDGAPSEYDQDNQQ